MDVSATGEPVPRSVQQDDYDALVLDIGLPGVDGLETLRRVRAQGLYLPVLMLAARDGVEDRVAGLESGADDYPGQALRGTGAAGAPARPGAGATSSAATARWRWASCVSTAAHGALSSARRRCT